MATRLEILQGYAPNQVRDTWIALGSAEINDSTPLLNKNIVFRCTTSGAPLNGAIFYCDTDVLLPPGFSWVNYTISDPVAGTIMDTNAIILPDIYIVLTQAAFQAITIAYNPSFIPFQEPNLALPVNIDMYELNRILLETGVPFINLEELEFSLDQILGLMVKPAMQEYFKWFPITQITATYLPNPNFSIPFPEGAVSVLNAQMIPGLPTGNVGGAPGNPLYFYYDEILMNINSPSGYSTSNSIYNRRRGFRPTTDMGVTILERAVRQGMQNYARRKRVHTQIQDGNVVGYCNERGFLEITWGYSSTNWTDIPYNMQSEVRKLAKAHVLRAFAMLRMQAKSDIPGTLNYEYFLTRADELEKGAIELFQAATKPIVIRS